MSRWLAFPLIGVILVLLAWGGLWLVPKRANWEDATVPPAEAAALSSEAKPSSPPLTLLDPTVRAAFDSHLSSTERNVAMEHMSKRCTPDDVHLLLALLTHQEDNEIIRSWGAQHIGCAWARMSPSLAAEARDRLGAILKDPSSSRLPRREALFALARRAPMDPLANSMVEREVARGIGEDANPDLDNLVRAVGVARLSQYNDRIQVLTNHRSFQVSGAAKEALALLDKK